MTALPEPPYEIGSAIREAQMRDKAELTLRASCLTGHGRELFIGTLIGYTDPVVRRAVLAALGGAEAGQGLMGEPRPSGPPWVIWCSDGGGQWAEVGHVDRDMALLRAAQYTKTARDHGLSLRYKARPEGQHPRQDDAPAGAL